MADQRQHPRYSHQLRVSCKNQQLAFDCLTRDICMGGVFIISTHRFPMHSPIDLEISFGADDARISCLGRVAWINAGQVETCPPGFGVEFLEVDEATLGRLLHDLSVTRKREDMKRSVRKKSPVKLSKS
jgi:Tfp pilus assembly protein PilZ